MINVWAIDKDIPLKLLLIEWAHQFGENNLMLNLAEAHFQAIELIAPDDPNLRAYVYTFAQPQGCYGIDLKYPMPEHNIIGGNENQSLEQIMTILQTHFSLISTEQQT
jgi:hypothetical protein